MNKVILIGRLCADPEINTYGSTTVANYRLAVDRPVKKEGQPEADFLTCKAFGKGADFVEKHLAKGIKIAVEGRIQTGSYEKEGVKHYTTEIIVDRHEFCESRSTQGASQDAQQFAAQPFGGFTPMSAADMTDNDLPF